LLEGIRRAAILARAIQSGNLNLIFISGS